MERISPKRFGDSISSWRICQRRVSEWAVRAYFLTSLAGPAEISDAMLATIT
jgi:hypothetical protein